MTGNIHLDALARRSVAEQVLVWLQRMVALYCLFFGVLYWGRIVGYSDMAPSRFDLMPMHWQVACATLAVLFPFAAIGLWMLASWGPVIWVIAAATETAMFAGYPQLFGVNRLVLISHAGTVLLYAACRIVIFLQKRKAEVSRN